MTLPAPDPPLFRWRYHFTDFRLGHLLATLPLADVSLSEAAGAAGSGTAVIPLSSARVRAQDPYTATTPRRTCMWAERLEIDRASGAVLGRTFPWAGIVMSRTRSAASRSMKLGMVTWESYFARRLVLDHLFGDADLFTIARTLVRDAVQQRAVPVALPPIPGRSFPPVLYGAVSQSDWDALLAAGWHGYPNDGAERIYHPLAPAPLDPVDAGSVSDAAWDGLLAAGWRGIPGDQRERLYPPPGLSTYTEPPTPGVTYYAPNPYPMVSPHHFLLDTVSGAPSRVRTDRSYLASDLKPVLSELSDLSVAQGFDWRLRPTQLVPGDLSTLRLALDLGYPRLGRVAPADLRWSTDRADGRSRWGYISDLTISEDGSAVNNRVTAVGQGSGDAQLRATVDASQVARDEFAGGYPIYEGAASSSQQDDRTPAAVAAKARGELLAGFASEVTVSAVKVRGDLSPNLDTYALYDDATLRIADTLTGGTTTIIGQITGRTFEPGEPGRTETVTMDVQGAQVPS